MKVKCPFFVAGAVPGEIPVLFLLAGAVLGDVKCYFLRKVLNIKLGTKHYILR